MSQGHSNYLSSLCLPPLSAVHMPMLIPRRPKGRLQDYPCVSWGRQDAGRHISSGWVEADDCNKTLHVGSIFSLGVLDFAECWWCCCWTVTLLTSETTPDVFAFKTTRNPCLLWPTYWRRSGGNDLMERKLQKYQQNWKIVVKCFQSHQPTNWLGKIF